MSEDYIGAMFIAVAATAFLSGFCFGQIGGYIRGKAEMRYKIRRCRCQKY